MSPRKRNALEIFPVRIDHVDLTLPLHRRAEDKMPSIWRPGRRIIHSQSCRQLKMFLTIGGDHTQFVLFPGSPAHVGDPISSRRPGRRRIIVSIKRQSTHVGSIRAHEKNLWSTASIGRKGELPTRRRPRGRQVPGRMRGQSLNGFRMGIQTVQFGVSFMA